MSLTGLEFYYIGQSLVRSQVGIAHYESCLVGLYSLYHGHLIFDSL